MLDFFLTIGALSLGVTVSYGISVSGAGVGAIQRSVNRTGSGPIGLDDTLYAAEAGSLTTRTDADTGEITMSSAEHTITTGATVDIYWDGGVQYGATVGTVSGTAVPIDTGSGDDLPDADTDVTVVVQSSANITIDGDETKFLSIELRTNDTSLRTAGHVQFVDSSGAEIAEIDLVTNVPQVWDIEGGSANPFTGNIITAAKLSQGGTDSAETYGIKIIGVQDATP